MVEIIESVHRLSIVYSVSLVLLLIAIVVLAIFIAKVRNDRVIRIFRIIFCISMVYIVTSVVLSLVFIEIKNDNLKTLIKEEYGLEIQSDIDYNFSASPISEKMYAKVSDTDPRCYEVYICKNNENDYALYTRNEKGVYLPVTKANVQTLKNGNLPTILLLNTLEIGRAHV